jgi:hypothetical protein
MPSGYQETVVRDDLGASSASSEEIWIASDSCRSNEMLVRNMGLGFAAIMK